MTTRDRIVIAVVAVAVILAAVWIEVVSPERKQASTLSAQVTAAQAQLSAAEGQATSERNARSQYASAYASIVSLGKAAPASEEVPALIDQLTEASNEKDVDFQSITPGGGGSATPSDTSTTGAAATTGATTAGSGGGLTQVPFSFTFSGSYFNLERLFDKLTSFATLDSAGNIEVSGRLLTIAGVSLSGGGGSSSSSSSSETTELTGTVTATAYELPAIQGATAASPAAPTGTTASPAASSSSSGSPTTPAVIKVNP
jgi:hypothetical protein